MNGVYGAVYGRPGRGGKAGGRRIKTVSLGAWIPPEERLGEEVDEVLL